MPSIKSKNYFLPSISIIVAVIVLSIAYFAGLSSVPFHPDESTQIFMSRDIDQFLQQPSQFFWSAGKSEDLWHIYHLLDAPMTRYLIGLGRKINHNIQPLPSDWNWSASWEENQKAGAIPDFRLLLTSRVSTSIFFPFSCLLIFLIGMKLGGKKTGWLAMLLFAGNSLVLIHSRRAMAESVLIFFVLLTIFLIIKSPPNSWILGISTALAFNSKQSAIVLFIWGFICLLLFNTKAVNWKAGLIKTVQFSLTFLCLTFILNPFLWKSPLKAAAAALNARQALVEAQVHTFYQGSPDQVLSYSGERLVGIIANLYIAPPQIAEVGNYIQDTQKSANQYLSNPFNHLFTGFLGGGILLFLSLVGFSLLCLRSIKNNGEEYNSPALLCIGSLLQIIFNLAFIPLSFQRYVIPLVPFVCIFSAYSLMQVIRIKRHS